MFNRGMYPIVANAVMLVNRTLNHFINERSLEPRWCCEGLRRLRVVRSFGFRIQRKWIRLNEKESNKRWEPQARTFCLHNHGEWNDIVRSNVMVFLGSTARSVLSPSTKGHLFSSSLSPLIRFYPQPFNDCLVRLCRLCSVHTDEKVSFQTHSLPNGFHQI